MYSSLFGLIVEDTKILKIYTRKALNLINWVEIQAQKTIMNGHPFTTDGFEVVKQHTTPNLKIGVTFSLQVSFESKSILIEKLRFLRVMVMQIMVICKLL